MREKFPFTNTNHTRGCHRISHSRTLASEGTPSARGWFPRDDDRGIHNEFAGGSRAKRTTNRGREVLDVLQTNDMRIGARGMSNDGSGVGLEVELVPKTCAERDTSLGGDVLWELLKISGRLHF